MINAAINSEVHQMLAGHKILILITTYRRPEKLSRLVGQISHFICEYAGRNHYQIAITDSEPNNISPFNESVIYMNNKGIGFDSNLFWAFKRFINDYQYIFAIGDDDLLNPYQNPLHLIDDALASDAEVYLFNHYEFINTKDGINDKVIVGDPFYTQENARHYQSDPFTFATRPIPRYCGLVYRSRFIKSCLDILPFFNNTLHLYALPCLLAASHRKMAFVETPLTMFDFTPKNDGAWEDEVRVKSGLMNFCRALKGVVSESEIEIVIDAFYRDYFSTSSDLFQSHGDLYRFDTRALFSRFLERPILNQN